MCGIIGFIDKKDNIIPEVVSGLKQLEYRGYDSAGIAFFHKKKLEIVKAKGRIEKLETKLKKKHLKSLCGIGHTRWATHGKPSEVNCHPQLGGRNKNNFAVVHNGIIENYKEIRELLENKGYKFKSQTDTESVAHLLDYVAQESKNLPIQFLILNVIKQIKGSFALGIVDAKQPDCIIATKRDNPLLIGIGKEKNIIASDVSALYKHTKEYYVLDDNEVAILTPEKIAIYNEQGQLITKQIHVIDWEIVDVQKNDFKHFMLKEIFDQPQAIESTIRDRIKNYQVNLELPESFASKWQSIKDISIVACGSALNAGRVGQSVFESLAHVRSNIDIASEFRYKNQTMSASDLCIFISQSGETADTIAAMREAKKRGALTLAIVNVWNSTLAREADYVLYTHAGQEVAVATTKAYTCQVVVLYLLAIYFARLNQTIAFAQEKQLLQDICELPKRVNDVLKHCDVIEQLASQYADYSSVFFIGRGLDYDIANEASLKLKEISYIHSEAYAAGELKHGTISLVEKGVLVFGIATQSALMDKTLSNVREVIARDAKVILVTNSKKKLTNKYCDNQIKLAEFNEIFTPLIANVFLQLFAYYVAVERKCDIDKPRNLAKSVTVE